ncbi:hypothetical protein CN532_11445 [Bacillus wiedmannii]|nr:hypothetical protein CN532_11445 [Bacillus wiedmannii]
MMYVNTLNNDLKKCRIYYYKNFNDFFSMFKINYNLDQLKKVTFLSEISYMDRNYKSKAPFPLLIYMNQQEQLIVGENIFCVFYHYEEENKQWKTAKTDLYRAISKVNLTEKMYLRRMLASITNNIMEIRLSKDNYFNYFDNYILYGSSLQFSLEFDEIMQNEELEIKQIKFQLFDQSVVTIRDGNQIEFNKDTSNEEKIEFILFLSHLINDSR